MTKSTKPGHWRTVPIAQIKGASVAASSTTRKRLSPLWALSISLASTPALADTPSAGETAKPDLRFGATAGLQQTDRSAWAIGFSLEVRAYRDISIRVETQNEFGDIDDPFGPSNLRGGSGPHVNHQLIGPTWRPTRFDAYQLAVGAQAGIFTMHSTFAEDHFNRGPAAGAFIQAGRMLGPVSLALQLRLDVSASVEMAAPDGGDVPTTSGRLNLAFEIPLDIVK